MHRRTFRLRIAFGIGLVQSVDDSKITSVIYTYGRLIRINKLKISLRIFTGASELFDDQSYEKFDPKGRTE